MIEWRMMMIEMMERRKRVELATKRTSMTTAMGIGSMVVVMLTKTMTKRTKKVV